MTQFKKCQVPGCDRKLGVNYQTVTQYDPEELNFGDKDDIRLARISNLDSSKFDSPFYTRRSILSGDLIGRVTSGRKTSAAHRKHRICSQCVDIFTANGTLRDGKLTEKLSEFIYLPKNKSEIHSTENIGLRIKNIKVNPKIASGTFIDGSV